MGALKTADHIQIKIRMPNPNQQPPLSSKSGLKGHGWSLHLQNQDRAKIRSMCVPKTTDHIQIKIKMPNPSQEPPVSFKAHIRT